MIRWILLVAPTALLASWGAIYLALCFRSALDPARPLDIAIASPKGNARLRAERWRIDLQARTLTAERVRLDAPNGEAILSASRLRAIGPGEGHATIVVQVEGLEAGLERLADGTWKHSDLLPKPEKQRSATPFDVEVSSARLTLVDRTSPTPWRRRLLFDSLKIAGVGDRWLASGQIRVDDMGSASFALRRLGTEGLSADVKLASFESAPFLAHLRESRESSLLPALADVRARSATLTGSLTCDFPTAGPFHADGEVRLVARDLELGPGWTFAQASFDGRLTQDDASGSFAGSFRGASATLEGRASWAHGLEVVGKATAKGLNTASMPLGLRNLVPTELQVQGGNFAGWIAYDARGATADGRIDAKTLRWGDEVASNAAGAVRSTPDRTRLRFDHADWLGSKATGEVVIQGPGRSLTGSVIAKGIQIGLAARRLGRGEVDGHANVEALIHGTLQSPSVAFRGAATASVAIPGRPRAFLGNVDLAGRFSGGKVVFDRLAAAGPNGVFSAQGSWDVPSASMAFDVAGNGIDLWAFDKNLEGTGLFQAHVEGTPRSPIASGRAEVVGATIAGRKVAYIGGDFRWDRDGVVAGSATVMSGAARADGYGIAWRASDGALCGEFSATGLQPSDWLRLDAAGSLDVIHGALGGTLDRPEATFDGRASALVVNGVVVDSLQCAVTVDRDRARIGTFEAMLGGGTLNAQGVYDWSAGAGSFTAQVDALPVESFASLIPAEARFGGKLSAALQGVLADGVLVSASATDGLLRDLTLNGAYLGSGPWSAATTDGAVWEGALQVGELGGYVDIKSARYSSADGDLSAEISTYKLELNSLLAAFQDQIFDAAPDLAEKLFPVAGSLDLHARLSGVAPDINLDVDMLKASDLAISGLPSGNLEMAAKRVAGVWEIPKLRWADLPGVLTLSGRVDETADLALSGEIAGFPISRLAALDRRFESLGGLTDASFIAEGKTRSPVVRGTITATGLYWGADRGITNPTATLNLDSMVVADGSVTAEGKFTYRGIQGEVSGFVPFQYPLTIPSDREVSVRVRLPKRPLADMAEFASWMDASATQGTIEGEFVLGGLVGALKPNGRISVEAPAVRLQIPGVASQKNGSGNRANRPLGPLPVQTWLSDLNATLALGDTGLGLDARLLSGRGGSASVVLDANAADALGVLTGGLDAILDAALTGNVVLDGFTIREDLDGILAQLAGETKATRLAGLGKSGLLSLGASGQVTVSGPVRSPLLRGQITVSGLHGETPSSYGQPAPQALQAINPRFDIGVAIASGANVKSGTADLTMRGSGRIGGDLFKPSVAADLTLEKGTLTLPNARVALDPGGTARFGYSVRSDLMPTVRLDVDFTGNTSLTALRYGDTLERYTIDLTMTGDVLNEGQLRLLARSDPPDLSQERILMLLGQQELFMGLAQGNESVLASYAIPAVFGPITRRLGTSLGLDYLSLEYDMFRRATVTAARTLGGGFSLMARRQITESAIGPTQYSLRLSYRLPFHDPRLRALSFGLGADQERPWKVGVEYGFRF